MVGVDTEVVAGIVGHVLAAHDTFLVDVAERKSIGRSSRTAAHAEVVALCDGVVLEHCVDPVGVDDACGLTFGVIVPDALEAAPVVGSGTGVEH